MNPIGVRVQEKGQVTIPRHIRKKLNLKAGDLVVFVETEAGVIVRPVALLASDDVRAETAAVVRSIRNRFKDYPADEIESLVEKALREVRGKGT